MGEFAVVVYDSAREFAHIRYKPLVLRTIQDVEMFARDMETDMGRIGRKIDVIVDLQTLSVSPGVAAAYDDARLRMFAKFAQKAYRYCGSRMIRTKILTSSAIHGQTANVFESFDEALAALLADRAAGSR